MSEPRALVGNAADPEQVERANRKMRLFERDEMADLRLILQTPHGRRFVWKILDSAGIFRSVLDGEVNIHYNAGRQDFGHMLMAKVLTANQEAYFQMMREAQKPEESNG